MSFFLIEEYVAIVNAYNQLYEKGRQTEEIRIRPALLDVQMRFSERSIESMPEIIHPALPKTELRRAHPDDNQTATIARHFTQEVIDAETKKQVEEVNRLVQDQMQHQQAREVPPAPLLPTQP